MKTRSFNILVVEDDASISHLLNSLLSRLGQKVEVAINGKEAITLFTLNPHHFEVVITDHSMPSVCGLELVTHLRKNGFEGKIIVISGSLTEELVVSYRAKRVDKILQKPFVPAELSFTLSVLFSQWSHADLNSEPDFKALKPEHTRRV